MGALAAVPEPLWAAMVAFWFGARELHKVRDWKFDKAILRAATEAVRTPPAAVTPAAISTDAGRKAATAERALAATIWGEARGESEEGKLAVVERHCQPRRQARLVGPRHPLGLPRPGAVLLLVGCPGSAPAERRRDRPQLPRVPQDREARAIRPVPGPDQWRRPLPPRRRATGLGARTPARPHYREAPFLQALEDWPGMRMTISAAASSRMHRVGPASARKEARELLRRDAGIAERAVLRLLAVRLTDGQFDALVTLRGKMNREEHALVQAQFLKLVWAGRDWRGGKRRGCTSSG